MQEAREENMILTQLGILLKKQFDENTIPFENQMNIDEYMSVFFNCETSFLPF